MASFDIAFTWLLTSEDPKNECAIVPDAPPGAHAISGINSHAFPTAFARIAVLPQSQRMAAVSSFYKTYFWNKWLDQLASDELAKRVFDAAVNMGSKTALGLLQRALWPSAEPDEVWGPETVSAANAGDLTATVEAFKRLRGAHYQEIVARNPDDEKYLAGWLARAEK
jgi:lysozyme family protein